MPLLEPTKELLRFLQKNPSIRSRVAAPPNTTLLYAGNFFKPIWKEIDYLKQTNPAVAEKCLLPDVLATIDTPGQAYPNLLAWAKALEEPWKDNGYIAWRALSGLFAANAVGAVSFIIGSDIVRTQKVFSATELGVLMRNTAIDSTTMDILAYYQRCVQSGQTAINFGYIAA